MTSYWYQCQDCGAGLEVTTATGIPSCRTPSCRGLLHRIPGVALSALDVADPLAGWPTPPDHSKPRDPDHELRIIPGPELVVLEAHGVVDAESARRILRLAEWLRETGGRQVEIRLADGDSLTEEGAALLLFPQPRLSHAPRVSLRINAPSGRRALLEAYARRRADEPGGS